jgi:hypothetical protein
VLSVVGDCAGSVDVEDELARLLGLWLAEGTDDWPEIQMESNRIGRDMNFVGLHTWAAIKRVARDEGQHWVAVPYVSPGAAKRLPLKRGDVLITRFDDATIMSGQTDPTEIARYIRNGVEVHNESCLHAKVYVSPKHAIICSANVSANSEDGLLEAGIEITNRRVISDARRFVQELRGNIIGLAFARSKVELFRSGGQARRAMALPKALAGHALWIVHLEVRTHSEHEEAAARLAKTKAIERMKDKEAFRLDDFTFSGRWPAKVGDYVVQTVRDGRRVHVEAPAQIIVIEPFVDSRKYSVAVVVEMRKRVRTRSLGQMDAAVRPDTSERFPRVHSIRRVRNDALRRSIMRQWPKVAETNVAR